MLTVKRKQRDEKGSRGVPFCAEFDRHHDLTGRISLPLGLGCASIRKFHSEPTLNARFMRLLWVATGGRLSLPVATRNRWLA